jgi:hypothetical protein
MTARETSMRFTDLIWKCCGYSWCVALILCCIKHVVVWLPEDLHSPKDWSGFATSMLPVCVLLLVLWDFRRMHRRQPLFRRRIRPSVWQDAAGASLSMRLAGRGWWAAKSLFCVLAILNSIPIALDDGAITLAYAADDLGFYRAGEWFYSLRPGIYRVRSLAHARFHDTASGPLDPNYPDTIVKVYGPESPEAAHIYFEMARSSDTLSRESQLYSKALAIYRCRGDNANTADVLSELALVAMCDEPKPDLSLARNLCEEALTLLQPELMRKARDTRCRTHLSLTLTRLEATAPLLQDNNLQNRIKERHSVMLATAKAEHGESDEIAALSAFVIFGTLLLPVCYAITKGLVLRHQNHRLKYALNYSDSIANTVDLLGKLARLELYRGNIDNADLYSRRSLYFAEHGLATETQISPLSTISSGWIKFDRRRMLGVLCLVLCFCAC